MRKTTLTIVLSIALLAAVCVFTGCAGSSDAKPSLELVKYTSYDLERSPSYVVSDDGTEFPIATLKVRNTGDVPIYAISISQSWLDKDGNQLSVNQYGIVYEDVVLPNQTVALSVEVPELDATKSKQITGFTLGEYAYNTIEGNIVKGTFGDAPESLPFNTVEEMSFHEEKPFKKSAAKDDVKILEGKDTLIVKSIKYDAKKHRVKVKLKNKSEKRIDWSNEPTEMMINFQCLDENGNICCNSGWAKIKKDGLDPGKSMTVKGEYYPVDDAKYITVTGITGFNYAPFHIIPKAAKIK